MSGFNKIIQIQPSRGTSTPLGVRSTLASSSLKTPQANQSNPMKNIQQAVLRQSQSSAFITPTKQMIPSSQARSSNFTPLKRPLQSYNHQKIVNAPIKKRSVELHQTGYESSYREHQDRDNSPSLLEVDENNNPEVLDGLHQEIEVDDEELSHDFFPGNQQAFFDNGFGDESLKSLKQNSNDSIIKTKVGFERVNEETVEMGGFVLPGSEKKTIHKSFNWIAGRADGQYRVVLGYNTLFKPKNAVDSTTGEKDFNRWRVIRFENRYKENYPYTEFPAKYLDPLIQALEKAREQHEVEKKEESVIPS